MAEMDRVASKALLKVADHEYWGLDDDISPNDS